MTARWPNDAPKGFQIAYVAAMTALILSGTAGLLCLAYGPP